MEFMQSIYSQPLAWTIITSQLLTSCLHLPTKKDKELLVCKNQVQETKHQDIGQPHSDTSIDHYGLQGGLPAKTKAALKDITIKHNGPFITPQPTYERLAIQSIQFMPHQGFWWAKPTYLSYSNATKRWKICTSKNPIPVETSSREPFYAEDVAQAQVTIDYGVEDVHANRPIPTFNTIQVAKTSTSNREPVKNDEQEANSLIAAEIDAIVEAAYHDLMYALQHPHQMEQFIINNQNQLDRILQQIAYAAKTPLIEAEATVFCDYLVQFIKMLKFSHKTIEDLYFGPDTSDYINQNIDQGIQALEQIEKHLQTSEQHIYLLCDMAELARPDLTLNPIFDIRVLFKPLKNKKLLLEILDMMLESKVPGGRLIQVILGTVDQPTTWEAWLPIVIETTLDFLPRGKAVSFMNFLSGKTTKNELKRLLIRQAKKQARLMDQENKQKQQLKAKKAETEQLSTATHQ